MKTDMPMGQPDPARDDEHADHEGMAMGAPQADGDMMQARDPTMAHAQGLPWMHSIAVILLGVWLITSPFTARYASTAMNASDVIVGAVVIGLALVTLARNSVWASWTNSLVGVWLLMAPLIFKAPTPAAFVNDWLVGALLIGFVLLMPGMPGMHMVSGPDIPRGWSYNPSSFAQRAPIIALALIAFLLSRQMAAYQLGYTHSVWEPFFNPGTKAVLGSDVSRSFPISDAGLGAVSYLLEGLMGFMGDRSRWRTMPWMVAFFGILVVPLGVVSIILIILQPLAVGTWCTPCLAAAVAMVVMIALTLDEVVATVQFLIQAHREGQPFWRTFWQGGALAEGGPQELLDPPTKMVMGTKATVVAMVRGVTLPWTLLVSAPLGLWMMSSPAIFKSTGNFAHADHLIGALVVTVSIIALAEVGRGLRYINVVFGAALIAAPWLLGGSATTDTRSNVIVGVLLIGFSLPIGRVGERYGSYQRFVR